MLPHFTHLHVLNNPYVVLCSVLDTDWSDLEVALDRLVSLERKASKGDSQEDIQNVFQSVYVFRVFGMYISAGELCNIRSRVKGLATRDYLQLRACGVHT